jgi:alkylation response protein AidB-like acyl-CoA dehydrogenase
LRKLWNSIGLNSVLTWDNAPGTCIYTIFEGASEIQRLNISRAISGVHIR